MSKIKETLFDKSLYDMQYYVDPSKRAEVKRAEDELIYIFFDLPKRMIYGNKKEQCNWELFHKEKMRFLVKLFFEKPEVIKRVIDLQNTINKYTLTNGIDMVPTLLDDVIKEINQHNFPGVPKNILDNYRKYLQQHTEHFRRINDMKNKVWNEMRLTARV